MAVPASLPKCPVSAISDAPRKKQVSSAHTAGGDCGTSPYGTRAQVESGLNAVMPVAIFTAFGPRSFS